MAEQQRYDAYAQERAQLQAHGTGVAVAGAGVVLGPGVVALLARTGDQ